MSSSTAENTAEPVLYAERSEWSDVVPIAQYENIQPLAPIFYSPECTHCPTICLLIVLIKLWYALLHHNPPTGNTDKDATDYFRAIVKAGEKSSRVLQLTETIIRLNPAHYSAWCVPFHFLVSLLFVLSMPQSSGNIAMRPLSPSPHHSSPSSSSPTRSPKPLSRPTRSGTTVGSSSLPYATPHRSWCSTKKCSRLTRKTTTLGATGSGCSRTLTRQSYGPVSCPSSSDCSPMM
jgi:hypothetical protein